ncbi:K+-dependent Na+/Ca+ exchanger [Desulfosarcina alkanivorans]|uniref:K+-dependent Na+/Ca+ exchanger n=1 Tax=Desulfosarcina alkanivorans TaxID=571177 RepID=A0A5K7YV15_9BACT|nr:calcium/sodium antiporter [Desulfosarcina alkanivorans]BBO71869.1 K+-dependent Na+/Ca+ exchanger [Desulfosarcina alkanivorans]
MIIPSLLLLAGFLVLIKGADLFVDGAARLARGMNVPPVAVGLTVVAFGTSAPELFVNISAAVSGSSDIALGNVVGSNIANVLLILGISSLIRPLTVSKGTVWKEIPLSLLAVVMLWILASDVYIDGAVRSTISRSDGLVLLGFFAIFIAYTASIAAPVDGLPEFTPAPADNAVGIALKMTIGFCGLLFGGRWIVDNAAIIGELLAIPRAVMGLTVVAVGTSLPELATSAMAARRGDVEIAVGNVVGSNIFNVFFILGVSAVIRPLPFNPAANVDMGAMMASGILLFVFMFSGRVRIMDRWEGGLALLVYGLYLGYLLYPLFPTGTPVGSAG